MKNDSFIAGAICTTLLIVVVLLGYFLLNTQTDRYKLENDVPNHFDVTYDGFCDMQWGRGSYVAVVGGYTSSFPMTNEEFQLECVERSEWDK